MTLGTRGVALVALALLGATLTGCTSVRNGLGPRESVCFRVLPAAQEAVHDQGSFGGLKYLSADSFATLLAKQSGKHPPPSPPPGISALQKSAVCLVEYHGTYTAAAVEKGWSRVSGPGSYAIVVIKQSTGEVIVTVVLHKPPLAFAKRVLG
jgi:hypothetical protein